MVVHVCSFCGKNAREVARMVAGPKTPAVDLHVCNECIDLAYEIVHELPGEGLHATSKSVQRLSVRYEVEEAIARMRAPVPRNDAPFRRQP